MQARQHEGEGAHQGHHGDLPDPPAVRQGGRGAGDGRAAGRGVGWVGGGRTNAESPPPQGTLQQFVDNFFQSVLAPGLAVPPAVKYFFDFLDEQAEKHDIKDEDTIHIWKTNRWAPVPPPAARPPAHAPASVAPHPFPSASVYRSGSG